MENKRRAPRTPLQVRIRIEHPRLGEMLLTTRDISDSGVFIVSEEIQNQLQLGEIVTGQVQGLPIEAPIVTMEVVRFESTGMGLRFVRD